MSALSAKAATSAYLSHHQIKAALELAVNHLCVEKPKNAFQFLSNQFNLFANRPKPQIVFVLGGPGAGKGTQCARITDDFGFIHLSAGDLLRDERKAGGQVGTLIDEFIKEGKIVPVEITVELLRKAITLHSLKGDNHFLVDGFPRNEDNLAGWNKAMDEDAEVRFVLFFDCPEKVMEDRLLERGKTSGRTDDNAESIRKRFRTYIEQTMPIVNHFAAKGRCHKIDSNQTVEQVYESVRRVFEAEFGPAIKAKLISTANTIAQAQNTPVPPVVNSSAQEPLSSSSSSSSSSISVEPSTSSSLSSSSSAESASSSCSSSSTHSDGAKPKVLFVLGGPGAGKGTQCQRIVDEFGFVHLSAGDLLRDERKAGGETGILIDEYIKNGQIVPVKITVGLLKKAMESHLISGRHVFLIDGFPRNQDNLEGWEAIMNEFATVELVLFFDCPEATMEERLLERGKTSGRTDDNLDSIKKRFQTYIESTKPIIEHFAKLGKVRQIDATRSVDLVYEDVQKILKQAQL